MNSDIMWVDSVVAPTISLFVRKDEDTDTCEVYFLFKLTKTAGLFSREIERDIQDKLTDLNMYSKDHVDMINLYLALSVDLDDFDLDTKGVDITPQDCTNAYVIAPYFKDSSGIKVVHGFTGEEKESIVNQMLDILHESTRCKSFESLPYFCFVLDFLVANVCNEESKETYSNYLVDNLNWFTYLASGGSESEELVRLNQIRPNIIFHSNGLTAMDMRIKRT